jgi:excisionase family DNA binding protein
MEARTTEQTTGQFLFVNESQLRGIISEEVTKALSQVKDKPRRMYTRFEAKDILNVTLGTLDNMVKRGDIQAIHIGRKVMFDADELDEAIEKGRVRRYKHQL